MREQKKPNFVRNKKLVKTTTFLAILLIATTLLLSNSVTAISISGSSTNFNITAKPIYGSIRDLSPNVKAALKSTEESRDIWDVQFSFDVTKASGASGNAGVEWDGSYFYTARWASNLIHKYNPDGTLVGAYTITGVSGLRDLAFDGTYMWGGNGAGTLWKMDFNSWSLLATFTGSFQVRAIAYDTDANIVYAKNWGDPCYKIDPTTGTVLGTFNLVTITSTYGLAYDHWTADGPFLWAFDQGAGAGTPQYIHQWDIAAGVFTGVTHDTTIEFPDPSGIAGGLFMTDSFVPGFSTLGGLQHGVPDRLFCYEIGTTVLSEHDVGVKSIDAPSSGGAASFTPKVTIKNNGNNSENVDVTLKIKKYTVPSVLMTEGFESWTPAASATFQPAGWVVYNVLGTNTWARYSTASYNKIGIYSAVSGYTSATTNDDWLVTKGVVVGSCDNKFSFWYRSYSTSYSKTIKVWMSTTGNTLNDFTVTGTLLATIGPFTTTTYTQYVYDTSAYVGTTLWFAVEDVSTTTYYVHVDGFILPNGEVQNFEGILTGWQTEWVTGTTDYDNEWDCIGSATSPTATPHGGAYMARYRSYSISSAHSARLKKLAPISLPVADVVNMKLWFFHYTSTAADKVDIQLSTNGCTWTTIQTIARYGTTAAWKEYTIDLSAWAGQTVYLSFLGTSYFGYNIYIDDLSIYSQNIITEYDQLKTTSIAIGEEKQLTFPDWEPEDWQNPATENVYITYDLEANATIVVDDNPGNNYKEKSIILFYPYLHDISVVSVNSPAEDGPAQTLPVGCTIMNVGQYQECCYQTGMQIGTTVLGSVILDEPFTINSWTVTNTKWSKVNSNYSGGTSPEYRFYYSPSETGTFLLYSPPINTAGAAAAKLSWKHMINHYTTPYTLAVMTSTDAINWETVWSISPSGSIPAKTEEITVTSGIGSSTFRIAFAFIGYSWNINYWYIDDVKLQAMSVIPEYTDTVFTIVLDPGESADLTFDDWTPADLALRISGGIDYVVQATQMLSTDTNSTNDVAGSSFVLSYWHDVKVKDITDPSMARGDIIFSQRPYLPTETWTFATSSIPTGYICQDDFWDLTDTIGDIEFYGVCLIYSGGWTPGNQNALEFELKFYEDSAGTPGTVVETFQLPAMTPVQYNTYSGFPAYYWAYDLPTSVGLANGWVSIQSKAAADNSWFLWSGSPEGNLNALQNGGALADNLAFNLSNGGAPGPVETEIFVPLNSDETIAGIVQNAGTFVENDLTCYAEIYEYITNESGVQVYSDSRSNVDLDPLGSEETVIFDNYKFEVQGAYNLILNIPLTADTDDLPANNIMKLGIGCDNTKPTSTHSLNPAAPNGKNGWYVSDLTITLDAKDGTEAWQSGVKEICYKVGGGAVKTIPGGHGSFKIEDDGEDISVEYWAVDKVGNEETHHLIPGGIDMDQTKPEIELVYEVTGGNSIQGWKFTFTANSTDDISGMDYVEFYFNNILKTTINGSGPTYEWTFQYNPIPKAYIKVIGYDIAGNNEFSEIVDPKPVSNEQTTPSGSTQTTKTVKINLGR